MELQMFEWGMAIIIVLILLAAVVMIGSFVYLGFIDRRSKRQMIEAGYQNLDFVEQHLEEAKRQIELRKVDLILMQIVLGIIALAFVVLLITVIFFRPS